MDAACCLPVLVIAAVTLLHLILQCGIEETATYALVQSARITSRTAAVISEEAFDEKAFRIAAAGAWEGMLLAEWGASHPDASLKDLSIGGTALLAEGTLRVDRLARVRVSVRNPILPVPASIRDPESLKNVVFRPFVGESLQDGLYDAVHVYVFPRRGERYHVRSCPVMQNGEIQTVLTESIRKSCAPCSLCHPDALPDGAAVTLFSAGSKVYHRQSCTAVTKNFICIPRSEAVARGYTPCQICKGGH